MVSTQPNEKGLLALWVLSDSFLLAELGYSPNNPKLPWLVSDASWRLPTGTGLGRAPLVPSYGGFIGV